MGIGAGIQGAGATPDASDAARETFALPPGCEEGYVEANGLRFHYVAAGAGPLVLLLHGFPEFWYSWRHQLPALATEHRVVALDLRGYNLTQKPESGYDVATLTDDIRAVIEALGERQADVVGHDWGGGLAWIFGIRAPDYLRRLVVVNAPHPAALLREMRSPGQLRRSWYFGFFQVPQVPEEVLTRDNYSAIARGFRAADRQHAWLSDEDIRRFVAAIARPGALTAAINYYRNLRNDLITIAPLRVITAPTLLLWGELDPFLSPTLTNGLDPWVRDLTVQRFSTAGHWLNQQEPAQVNEALLAFLR